MCFAGKVRSGVPCAVVKFYFQKKQLDNSDKVPEDVLMKPLPVPIPYDLAEELGVQPSNLCHINHGRRRLPIAKCIRLMQIALEDDRLAGLSFVDLRPELKPAVPWICQKTPRRRER